MINSFVQIIRKLVGLNIIEKQIAKNHEEQLLILGRIVELKIGNPSFLSDLSDVEFKVFSQWGDDGIISWLVKQLDLIDPFFVEFGVQNYKESNSRYLLTSKNWSGAVIDGNKEFTDFIKEDSIHWKHSLKVVNQFITKSNINDLLKNNCPRKDIDLLSIDIDGNDYWIFKEISEISPKIIICEYNGLFGQEFSLTTPYDDSFVRSSAHYSHLYFGASIKALIELAEQKGYEFIGTNSNGNNAYFVRDDLSNRVSSKIKNKKIFAPKFRESRSVEGKLTALTQKESINLIKNMEVYNLKSKINETISQTFSL